MSIGETNEANYGITSKFLSIGAAPLSGSKCNNKKDVYSFIYNETVHT